MLKVFAVKTLISSVDNIDYELEYISLEPTCCAVYLNSKNNVLLVRQYRPLLKAYSVEIPGGSKHNNELAEDGAKREFREETGLIVKNIEPLASFYLSVGTSDEKVNVFLVTEVESEGPLFSVENGVEPFWMEQHMCMSMINSGEIVDAKTIIALQSIWCS